MKYLNALLTATTLLTATVSPSLASNPEYSQPFNLGAEKLKTRLGASTTTCTFRRNGTPRRCTSTTITS
jgi:hypothetical protein